MNDVEAIVSVWTIGGLDPSPSVTRLNFTFITDALELRTLSVRCRNMQAVCGWLDTLLKLAGYSVDDIEGNWDILRGEIFYLRIRDHKTIVGILDKRRKNILKIKAEFRYD